MLAANGSSLLLRTLCDAPTMLDGCSCCIPACSLAAFIMTLSRPLCWLLLSRLVLPVKGKAASRSAYKPRCACVLLGISCVHIPLEKLLQQESSLKELMLRTRRIG